MIKRIIPQLACLILLLLLSACKATAQKRFTTHAVKRGETLQSIAEQYQVTPYSILLANKELNKATDLKPNTVVIIDLTYSKLPSANSADESEDEVSLTVDTSAEENRVPIGFRQHIVAQQETMYGISRQYEITIEELNTYNPQILERGLQPEMALRIPVFEKPETGEVAGMPDEEIPPKQFLSHKVKRRETIFSLTQRYGISEEQLKRHNRQLYARPLEKGMTLMIPVYPTQEEIRELGLDMVEYTVQPRETRWSIAHKYGISVDSLEALNPDLPVNSSYLSVGQLLTLPRPTASEKEDMTQLYESYVVPARQTLYSLSREYEIDQREIIRLNPEISEVGGLKVGMTLRLPRRVPRESVVNADNYVFYPVKKGEGIFRITRKLGIARDSLYMFNPELEAGVREGMVLKIPVNSVKGLESKDALILDAVSLVDSIRVENQPNLLFLLPFRLDRVNPSDREQTVSQIRKRRDISASLGLYTGALVALDSIKKLGVSARVSFRDTELDTLRTESIIRTTPMGDVDAIVGPLSPSVLRKIALDSTVSLPPVFAPFAASDEFGLPGIFFTVPDKETQRESMLRFVASRMTDVNVIVVADPRYAAVRDTLLSRFPGARAAELSEDQSVDLNRFGKMFVEDKPNWVFLETDKGSVVSSITSILNSINSEQNLEVRLFATQYGPAYEGADISRTQLSNLSFTFPSVYRETASPEFTETYQRRFGIEPDRYAIRGFDLTMDILLKLTYNKDLAATVPYIGQTEYSGSRFNYFFNWESGYDNRSLYILTYDDLTIREVTGNY